MKQSRIEALKRKKEIPLLIVAVGLVVIIGTIVITTHASSPFVSTEAESGTLVSPASTVSDANASGGTAVKFGSSSSGGITFNHCTNPTTVIPATLADPQSGVSLSGYYVDNDSWNFSKYPTSTQTLYVCNYNNFYAMVNVSDTANNGEVKTYPSVHDDFNSPALSSFHSITSVFAETAPTYGAWDIAYDIWVNNYATELMIWNQSNGRQAHVPGIPIVGTVTLSGITYNIHKTAGSYIAYDMPTTTTSGNINILEILKDMESRGFIASTSTLSSIQYGVEVCDVGGINTKFEINNFSVTTN